MDVKMAAAAVSAPWELYKSEEVQRVVQTVKT